jgi:sulfite reductase beta subunit-like hemoprotein
MPNDAPPPAEPKLSPVEGHKEASQFLRFPLAAEVADPATDHLSDAAKNLIKFHGSYQQEDRDARKNRSKAGVGKAYMFMIRLKLPGGKLTADQYLALDELAGRYANGTLRFTTRQSVQFHGVLKGDLKATMAGINATLVTTLGGCGDVNRNVMACPAPTGDPVRRRMQELADAVAAHLAPAAGKQAYHEIWLNGSPKSRSTAARTCRGSSRSRSRSRRTTAPTSSPSASGSWRSSRTARSPGSTCTPAAGRG